MGWHRETTFTRCNNETLSPGGMFLNSSDMHLCPFAFFVVSWRGFDSMWHVENFDVWLQGALALSGQALLPVNSSLMSLYPSSFYLAKSDNSVSGLLLTFAWRLPRLSSGACVLRASGRRGVSSHKAGAFSCSSADSSIKPTHPLQSIHLNPSSWSCHITEKRQSGIANSNT